QMNREDIWSACDDEKYLDSRVIPLLARKKIDDHTLELSFKRPANFDNTDGQYTILKLADPKVTELDLPYRWLRVSTENGSMQFQIKLDGSSFAKSCELLDEEDQVMVLGPVS
ncbi:MAG: NAD(P)/FAD-dependent oxidoreductase, partial [Bacteroidota bacterium]